MPACWPVGLGGPRSPTSTLRAGCVAIELLVPGLQLGPEVANRHRQVRGVADPEVDLAIVAGVPHRTP